MNDGQIPGKDQEAQTVTSIAGPGKMSTSDGDETVHLLHAIVAKMLKTGSTEMQIWEELQTKGVEPAYGRMIIDNVYRDIHRRRAFWYHLLLGIFVTVGGVIINYLSYRAGSRASFFYVFWGIVVFGITIVLRAIILFRR